MTRLLQIVLNAEGTVGGEQRHVLQVLDGLDRSRYEPAVVTWDVPAFVAELDARGIPVTAVSGRRILDFGLLRRLTDIVRSGGFDLVHAHGHRAGLLGRIAAVRARTPRIVWTCHLAENKSGRNPAAHWGYRRAMRWLHRRTDVTLAVSSILRDWLAEEGIPADEVTVVPNGVDCDVFRPLPPDPELARELGADPGAPLLVCVARLTPQKGVETLVRASAELRRRGVAHAVAVVGAGPLEGPLRALAADVAAPVAFAGERGDIPAVLALADVAVVPSLWEGAFCFSVLEAMACARPVVCSDIPVLAEVVAERGVARTFAAGDADALATAIGEVLADADAARAMGDAARRLVTERYSVASMRSAIAGIYERLTAKERS